MKEVKRKGFEESSQRTSASLSLLEAELAEKAARSALFL